MMAPDLRLAGLAPQRVGVRGQRQRHRYDARDVGAARSRNKKRDYTQAARGVGRAIVAAALSQLFSVSGEKGLYCPMQTAKLQKKAGVRGSAVRSSARSRRVACLVRCGARRLGALL